MSALENINLAEVFKTPGSIIEIADLTQIAVVEDMIAPLVEPTLNMDLWLARPPVKELLRPMVKKRPFNGRLTDITLEVMANAYDRLQDAPERGYSVGSGRRTRDGEVVRQSRAQYIGLIFTAALASSSPGIRGGVTAELYYAPPLKYLLAGMTIGQTYTAKNGEARRYTSHKDLGKSSDSGKALQRFVSKPLYDEAMLVAADERSKINAFKVERSALIRAVSTPMSQ